MSGAEKPNLIRRRLLQISAGLASVPVLQTTFFLSLLTASRPAEAQAVAAIAVIGAILNLISSIHGTQLDTVQLKLDQILDNQVRIIQAINVLQQSIADLQKAIPGFLTNEAYRLLWENADATFNASLLLTKRAGPITDKLSDYKITFQDLYDGINLARSRVNTTTTGTQGVASILSGGQAMLLYVHAAYALANLEANLPRGDRWSGERAAKFRDMATLMRDTLTLLITKRIPEALKEQQNLAVQAKNDVYNSPFGDVLDRALKQRLVAPAGTSPNQANANTIDICLRSSHEGQGLGWTEIDTLDFTMTYKVYEAGLPTPYSVATFDFSVVPNTWKRRIYWKSTADTWFEFGNHNRIVTMDTMSPGKGNPCISVQRNHTADILRPPNVPAEFTAFSQAMDRYTQAVLNQKILSQMSSMCQQLIDESGSFDKAIVQSSKRETFLQRLWDLIP